MATANAPIEVAVGRKGGESLHELAQWIQQLQDEERGRIARELHDGTAQLLAGLMMNLSIVNQEAEILSRQAQQAMAESIALADRCVREIRTAAYLLHPPELEGGLRRALAEYVDGYAQRSGIRVDLALPPDLGGLPREVESALFRIAQEALTNIYRHSRSATAGIRLNRDASTITMEIGDKGRGMRPRALTRVERAVAAPGIGITSMQERATRLGGLLDIRSEGRGTTVRVVLPLLSGEHG
jgi:signal transduction histidine kinase